MSVMAWLMIGLIIIPVSAMVWSFISIDRGGLALVRGNLGRGFRVVEERNPTADTRGPAAPRRPADAQGLCRVARQAPCQGGTAQPACHLSAS